MILHKNCRATLTRQYLLLLAMSKKPEFPVLTRTPSKKQVKHLRQEVSRNV